MGVFSKPKSGPSAAEIQAQQEAAAKAERQRLEAEQAQKDQEAKEKALKDLQDQEAKRAAFVGQLQQGIGEDDAGRKKFLKGV